MTAQQIAKRVIDVVVATTALLALSPLLVVTAILIYVLEGRPIFYLSRRNISTKEEIVIPKFRSMVRDAKSSRYRLNERYMRDGYLDIPLECEVYTPIGRLVERTQLVEVPQLINVFRGKMSLIGNRPLPKENLRLLSIQENWEERFESPAGISGISQIVGKLKLDPSERLLLERAYSEVYKRGNLIKCDFLIWFYTVRLIAFGKGISLVDATDILRGSVGGELAIETQILVKAEEETPV